MEGRRREGGEERGREEERGRGGGEREGRRREGPPFASMAGMPCALITVQDSLRSCLYEYMGVWAYGYMSTSVYGHMCMHVAYIHVGEAHA